MACAKVVLAGTSPAIRHQFTDEVELKMCERTGESIAEAILYLKDNPTLVEQIAQNARQAFLDNYSITALGRTFREHLETLI